MQNLESTVEKFSLFWWQSSGLTFLLIPIVLFILYKNKAHSEQISKYMGFNMLYFAVTLVPLHLLFEPSFEIRHGLPFHLCRIAAWITIFALFSKKQWAYETSLFLAITGGFNALFTPQFTQGTHWYFVAEFYWSHALLIIAPLFLSFNFGMQPQKYAWLRAFGRINAIAFVVYWINIYMNTNYMFLVEAPKAKSPFLFSTQWPYYIWGMEIGILIFFVSLYSFFFVYHRLKFRHQTVSI